MPTKDFWDGLGMALVISAILGPLSYCTVKGNQSGQTNDYDLIKACIEQRGVWTSPESWTGHPYCKFPEKQAADKGN